MTPNEASQILQLPEGVSPGELEVRFRELRAQYEAKIASALTPGLREKYTTALSDVTLAYETLVLSRDATSMPGLSRPPAAASASRLPPLPSHPVASAPPPPPVAPTPVAAVASKKSPLKWVLLATVVLAGAGSLVLWQKAGARAQEEARLQREAVARDEAEAAKLAAEAKAAEQQRVAATEKAARDQVDQALAALRPRQAEINASLDTLNRSPQALERELVELKSRRDELAAEGKTESDPALRLVTAQIAARERHAAWLTDALAATPVKTARRQAADAMLARSPEAVASALDAYGQAVRQLQVEITRARTEHLAITGRMRLASEPSGVPFKLTDAFGREREARTPAELSEIAFGDATVVFTRPGFPPLELRGTAVRDSIATVSADLRGGALMLDTEPFPADFRFTGQGREEQGHTPATFEDLPPGDYRVSFERRGWPAQQATVTVARGGTARSTATFAPPGSLKLTSEPAGAEVVRDGQPIGTTPLVLRDLPPGPVQLSVSKADFRPAEVKGTVEAGKEITLSATLRSATLTPEEAYDKLAKEANGTWACHTTNGLGGSTVLYMRFTTGSRTLTFQQTGFGGSTRKMTMVGYIPETRIVQISFGGLDALNGKISIRLDGDKLLFGRGDLTGVTNVFKRE